MDVVRGMVLLRDFPGAFMAAREGSAEMAGNSGVVNNESRDRRTTSRNWSAAYMVQPAHTASSYSIAGVSSWDGRRHSPTLKASTARTLDCCDGHIVRVVTEPQHPSVRDVGGGFVRRDDLAARA